WIPVRGRSQPEVAGSDLARPWGVGGGDRSCLVPAPRLRSGSSHSRSQRTQAFGRPRWALQGRCSSDPGDGKGHGTPDRELGPPRVERPLGGAAGSLLLISCLQPVPAQTSITIAPQSPAVGRNVSLAPQPLPQDWLICKWFRSASTEENRRIFTYYPNTNSAQTNGPAHTGRETAGSGCALNIVGLKLSDTGSYTVQVESPPNPVTVTAELRVYESAPPNQGTSLSAGSITGIIIGTAAGAALVGVVAYFLCE
uniref:Immunoglobulin V-set domain-containing protein n=1 Tax=Pelusios castaneus TaxID=367368 RepID=A0A8C8S4G0_9SAUR